MTLCLDPAFFGDGRFQGRRVGAPRTRVYHPILHQCHSWISVFQENYWRRTLLLLPSSPPVSSATQTGAIERVELAVQSKRRLQSRAALCSPEIQWLYQQNLRTLSIHRKRWSTALAASPKLSQIFAESASYRHSKTHPISVLPRVFSRIVIGPPSTCVVIFVDPASIQKSALLG